jgi:hypothetical protein
MTLTHTSKKLKILIPIFVALLLGGALYFFMGKFPNQPQHAQCTAEAKLCEDGSYVGRIGPNCEFAACPESTSSSTSNIWKTYADASSGISFRYPKELGTQYIHPTDWPPKGIVTEGIFSCSESGSEINIEGQTKKWEINGRIYCITKKSEGAAGSIYTNYAYTMLRNGKLFTLTFDLRSVQCANYDNPKKTECENERNSFDINGIVDRIMQSVVIQQ